MLPFISRRIRLFISIAYSSGSSLDTLSANPDTIPAMDIRVNDADVGHEATIGRISDDAVFYLMSRGIPEDDARAMIVSDLEISSIISD